MSEFDQVWDESWESSAGRAAEHDLFCRVEHRLMAALSVAEGKFGKFGEGQRSAYRDALRILELEVNR